MTNADLQSEYQMTSVSKIDTQAQDKKSRISKTMLTTMANQEDDESEEEKIVIPKKFKADTDHKNTMFEQSLRQRTMCASSDFKIMNK